jgi:hypothetical protein
MGPQAQETLADAGQLSARAPKQCYYNGQLYIEIAVDRKRNSAWYWAHGKEFECQTPNKQGKKALWWACKLCTSFKAYLRSGSQHINQHLRSIHHLQQNQLIRSSRSVLDLQQNARSNSYNAQLSDIDNLQIQKAKFEEALISWVTCDHIPFTVVKSPLFQQLLTLLSDRLPSLLCTSHNSLRASIMKDFSRRRGLIERWIKRRKSTKIHFSFDLWSSPNGYAMLTVVAYFVSDYYSVKAPLLSLRPLEGPHSGENQAQAFRSTLTSYNIEADVVGCFVLDNAYNNDTCLRQLESDFSWPKREWRQRRLRCFGHIINLAAQAFLFGEKDEAFEDSLRQHQQELKSGQIKLWELCRPISKLHYIVFYIRKTP